MEQGCLPPLYDEEIVDPTESRVLLIAEAFWPNGLRAGLGDQVVLELDPLADSDIARLEELGFKVFTDLAALEGFVRHANEVASGDLPDDSEPPAVASSVEAAFSQAMKDVYRRAKDEAGYNATLFLRMLSVHGPLETARRLINSSQPSDGFTQLWERHRLDLTVEAQVLRPEFVNLFTEDEVTRCRTRLQDYGFTGV